MLGALRTMFQKPKTNIIQTNKACPKNGIPLRFIIIGSGHVPSKLAYNNPRGVTCKTARSAQVIWGSVVASRHLRSHESFHFGVHLLLQLVDVVTRQYAPSYRRAVCQLRANARATTAHLSIEAGRSPSTATYVMGWLEPVWCCGWWSACSICWQKQDNFKPNLPSPSWQAFSHGLLCSWQ